MERPALGHVAVLGPDAPRLAARLASALRAALAGPDSPDAPSVELPLIHGLERFDDRCRAAGLRLLLAWDASNDLGAIDAIAALEAHQAFRGQLHEAQLSYQVLRGTEDERILQALQSLRPWYPALAGMLPSMGVTSRRPGLLSCDKCGDPDCEHRSFTELLARRGQAPGLP